MDNRRSDKLIDQKKQARNLTLDIYKGVLIILVVIRHVLQYSVSDEGGILTNFIWAVQMPGFMLVSGYFSYRTIGSLNDLGRRIINSAVHYAMPFLTWFLLVSVLLRGENNRNMITAIQTLFTHVDRGLWFLWVIFVLSIFAAVCDFLISRGKKKASKQVGVVGFCIMCFGILLALAKAFGLHFLGIKFILYYAVFYGFGWLIRATENIWKAWLKAKNLVIFGCLVIFLAIVYNYDLYHSKDGLDAIVLRLIAGFTGNAVLLCVCEHFQVLLAKGKLDWIGRYTLEIYCTHMYVNNLFQASNSYPFFTAMGFHNFAVSLISTVVLTAVIIATFKSIPAANWLMYGKKPKNDTYLFKCPA